MSQALGNSSSISFNVMEVCRWRRLNSLGRCSPFGGRPARRFGFAAGDALGAGFSRPAMAVESLETCPAKWLSSNASCKRPGRSPSANSAKARENVASLGTLPAFSQPHNRCRVASFLSHSTSARVVTMSSTALARKARASAARSSNGRPRQPLG